MVAVRPPPAVARAIEVDPRLARAHWREASTLVNLGHLDEGMAAIDKAYARKPNMSMRWVRALLPAGPEVDLDACLQGTSKAGPRE